MSTRQQTRRMRPDAYDPWQHNRDVATRKAILRVGRSADQAARGLRRFSTAIGGLRDAAIAWGGRVVVRDAEALLDEQELRS
jgi:hypothetical protein